MLNPYDFINHIEHCKYPHLRKSMGRLAVNIYFGAERSEFDVSEFLAMAPHARIICLAAMSWAHTHTLPITSRPSYQIGGEEVLHDRARLWLEDIAAGRLASQQCPL